MNGWLSEILAGIAGGIVFFIVFLFGGSFLIGLGSGIFIFLVGRVMLRKGESAHEELSCEEPLLAQPDLMEDGQRYLIRLDDYIRMTDDSEIRRKLISIRELNHSMLEEARRDPVLDKVVKDLVTFYLPSICKIFDQYLHLISKGAESRSVAEFKKELESFLDELIVSFKKQMDGMLSDNIYDAKLEMAYVKNIMKGDGFLNMEFDLKGEEKDES